MTTSITIPDPLFASTESLASRLKISRNEVVTRALAKFILENTPSPITADIDKFIEENGQPEFDAGIARASLNVLKKAEW